MRSKIILLLLISLVQFQCPEIAYGRQPETEFSSIQKKFIREHISKSQLFWFQSKNLLVAYENGYLTCLKKDKEFQFSLDTYSENEYHLNIVYKNSAIGRLYLNSEFNPEYLVLSDKKFSEKIGLTELTFDLERKLSDN